jgi:hypothetical protein
MCDKCEQLDKKIEHYRQLSRQVNDQPTLEGIDRLIAQCLSRKIGFHASLADQK